MTPPETISTANDPTALVLPDTALSLRIHGVLDRGGRALSWIWIVLLVVIVANVVMRYVFGTGRIEFEELQWHLYSVGFLYGVALCVRSDEHVRVDFLRARFTLRMQAWIELYGFLLLVLPFTVLVLVFAVPFVAESYAHHEVSPSPGGLPMRYLIKAALPAGFVLLILAAFARISQVSALLFSAPCAIAPAPDRENPLGGA